MAMQTSFHLAILEARATSILYHFRKTLEILEVHSSIKLSFAGVKKLQYSKESPKYQSKKDRKQQEYDSLHGNTFEPSINKTQ